MPRSRPRRSALYMPGSNARALEKARTLPADVLLLDLEDAVAPEAKDEARRLVTEAVAARGFGPREVVIRINALSTPWGEADLTAAVKARPDAILVPKVASGAEVARLNARLDEAGAPAELALWVMMETPLAIFNAAAMAGAGGRLACLVMGTNDLVKELHAQHVPGRAPLQTALQLSVAAARAYGLTALDGVFNDIQDLPGFEAQCAEGLALGFDGKTLIHPGQVAAANQIFAPSAEAVASARKILAAFAEPQNKGKGAISLDGRMVELLHADIAARVVGLAEAIEQAGRSA